MFSCFSKKRNKPEPTNKHLLKYTKLLKEQAKPSLLNLALPESKPAWPENAIGELKSKEDEHFVKAVRFQSIDNLLREEIQIQEKTASFNNQVPSSEHLPRFVSIYDEPQRLEIAEAQQQQLFLFQQRGQSCDLASTELNEGPSTPVFKGNQIRLISGLENCGKIISSATSHSIEVKAEAIQRFENLQEVAEFETTFSANNKEIEKSLDTTITLQNFRLKTERIQKKEDQEQDEALKQSYEQAQNTFYCVENDINQQFTRAVVVHQLPQLAKSLFLKMNSQQKNRANSKGYTPVQLVVVKALASEKYTELAKLITYDQEVWLQCRGPQGWTPLQQALIKRNIPLSTHLFRSAYYKKQQKFKKGFTQLERTLHQIPNFEMEIQVKVDSFFPLVGALTPSDTLKLKKVGGKIMLQYTLVGYQFPICKRREMGVFFDGSKLLALNNSKGIYCDLLQELDQEQMVLLVQDMLSGDIKKGEPIVHEFSLNKSLSLFDNEKTNDIGGHKATKYQLELRYTSTAEKRRSNRDQNQDISYLKDYVKYRQKKTTINIQQKNKNKKVQLQLWLASSFGLELETFIKIIQILGAGNTLLGKWGAFFKEKLRNQLSKEKLFPVQIDIPLNYSLYFNIKFNKFEQLQEGEPEIQLNSCLKQIERKQFQGVTQSRQKRALFLQAYT